MAVNDLCSRPDTPALYGNSPTGRVVVRPFFHDLSFCRPLLADFFGSAMSGR